MNLYQLERMKLRLSTYLWAILGIFVSLLCLGILFLFIFQMGEEADLFADWNGLVALTMALAFACFSVFAAVISAKVVVSEYCGKNAVILLTYPIKRKTILRTKCRMICGIIIFAASISSMAVIGIMYITAALFGIEPQMSARYFILVVLLSSIFVGILSSAVGVIATVFGWKKRSVIATVLCSLLMVCMVTNMITISPRNLMGVLLIMSMIFVVIASGLYKVLADDIEKMEV